VVVILEVIALCLNVALAQPPIEEDFEDTLVVEAEELPIQMELPRDELGAIPWHLSMIPEPGIEYSLSRYVPSPSLVLFGWQEGYQPALDRLELGKFDAEALTDWAHFDQGTAEVEISQLSVTRASHETLGDVVVVDFVSSELISQLSMVTQLIFSVAEPPPGFEPEPEPELPVEAVEEDPRLVLTNRVIFYAAEAGVGYIMARLPGPDAELPELTETVSMDDVMTEVSSFVTLARNPLPTEDLLVGDVTMEVGYELSLGENWRALSPREMNAVSMVRVADGPYEGYRVMQRFVDPASIDRRDGFTCVVHDTQSRPIEVIDPAKSAQHRTNYLTHARVMLKGGTFSISSGGKSENIKVDIAETRPVTIEEDADGVLSVMELEHREAFYWRVNGMQSGEPVSVAAYYTAWDNLGLDCFAVARSGEEELLDVFESAVSSIRVTDAESHPMVLSFMSKYRRWWPYAHPALQLYWLIFPLFMGAMIPMFKEWMEARSSA